MMPDNWHFGRSFSGHPLEDECPCEQEPCGLVSRRTINPDCLQHPMGRAKTIRQGHDAADCPGSEDIDDLLTHSKGDNEH